MKHKLSKKQIAEWKKSFRAKNPSSVALFNSNMPRQEQYEEDSFQAIVGSGDLDPDLETEYFKIATLRIPATDFDQKEADERVLSKDHGKSMLGNTRQKVIEELIMNHIIEDILEENPDKKASFEKYFNDMLNSSLDLEGVQYESVMDKLRDNEGFGDYEIFTLTHMAKCVIDGVAVLGEYMCSTDFDKPHNDQSHSVLSKLNKKEVANDSELNKYSKYFLMYKVELTRIIKGLKKTTKNRSGDGEQDGPVVQSESLRDEKIYVFPAADIPLAVVISACYGEDKASHLYTKHMPVQFTVTAFKELAQPVYDVLLKQPLEKNEDKKIFVKNLLTLEYYLSNMTPLVRGSSSTAERVIRKICLSRELENSLYDPSRWFGIRYEFHAFSTTLMDYIAERERVVYAILFEPDTVNESLVNFPNDPYVCVVYNRLDKLQEWTSRNEVTKDLLTELKEMVNGLTALFLDKFPKGPPADYDYQPMVEYLNNHD